MLAACGANTRVPAQSEIGCDSAKDCPEGWTCSVFKLCIRNDALAGLDTTVRSQPTLELPLGQTRIKDGDLLRIGGIASPDTQILSVRLVETSSNLTVQSIASSEVSVKAAGTFVGSFTAAGLRDGAVVALEIVVEHRGVSSVPADSRSGQYPVDNSAPTGVAVSVDQAMAGFVGSTSVDLTLTAAEAVEMFLDGDIADGPTVRSWLPYSTSAAVELLPDDGVKIINVRFRDGAHNEAPASTSVTLDRALPTVDVQVAGPWPVSRVTNFDLLTIAGTTTGLYLESAHLWLDDGTGQEVSCPGFDPNVTDQLKIQSGVVSGALFLQGLCNAAYSIGIRVSTRNAAGFASLPEAGESNFLLVDLEPPTGGTVVHVPTAPARERYTSSVNVVLQLGADDPVGDGVEVRVSGSLAQATPWLTFPDGSGALPAGQIEVELLAGNEHLAKDVIVHLRDAVHNETTLPALTLTLDTVPPPAPRPDRLKLEEVWPEPTTAANKDRSNNTFQLTGLSGSIVESDRLRIWADAALTDLVVAQDITGDAFATLALGRPAPQRFWVVAMDKAGNASPPTPVSVPTLTIDTFAPSALKADAVLALDVSSDVPLAEPPTLNVAGAMGACTGSGTSFTCTFQAISPRDDASQGYEVAIARLEGIDGQLVTPSGPELFARGTRGTVARALTLDFSPPVLNASAVVVSQNPPLTADTVEGGVGAVDDAAGADSVTALLPVSVDVLDRDGVTVLATRTADAQGAFSEVSIGDNAEDEVTIRLTDAAGNTSSQVFANDILFPLITSLSVAPTPLAEGETATVSFTVAEANDLAAEPSVTIGGTAATLISGSTSTSAGPQDFVYELTVLSSEVAEGDNEVSILLADPAGNQSTEHSHLVADYSPPVSTLTTPGDKASWNGSPGVNGRSVDTYSAVALVEVAVREVATGMYWNDGTGAFDSTSPLWQPALGTDSWAYDVSTLVASPLTEGTQYELFWQATDAVGNKEAPGSQVFAYDSSLPAAPTNLRTASVADAETLLQWDPPAGAQPTEYRVYYDFAAGVHPPYSGAGATIHPLTVSGDTTLLAIPDLAAGDYVFAVTAVDSATNESPYSNQVAAASRWWEWKNPRRVGGTPNDLAVSSNGVFVAVGAGGSIWRSDDGGVSWTMPPSSTTSALSRVCAVGDVFVAVGPAPTILRSTDAGLSWSVVASPTTGRLNDLFCSATLMLSVSDYDGHVVIRSLDSGASWEKKTPGVSQGLWAVTAVGTTIVAGGSNGLITYSQDGGENWSQVDLGTTSAVRALWANGGTFVGVGDAGLLARSANSGATWTKPPSPTGSNLKILRGAGTNVLAMGNESFLYSLDGGQTWAKAANPVSDTNYHYYPQDVWYDGSRWVAVAYYADSWSNNGGRIFTSDTAGQDWTERPTSTTRFIYKVRNDGSGWVALGTGMEVHRSTDQGATWSVDTNEPSTSFYDVVNTGSSLVAVGAAGTIARSTDGGVNWSVQAAPRTLDLKAVTDVGGVLVAGGNLEWILRSTDDGVSWTEVSYFASGADLADIWGDASTVVAVGRWGRILVSGDAGLTWTRTILPVTNDLAAVDGTASSIVTVGANGLIAYSKNSGASWFAPASGGSSKMLSGVWGTGSTFVAVGNTYMAVNSGEIIRSTDGGTNWSTVSAGVYGDFWGIHYTGARLLALASGGQLVVSDNLGLNWSLGATLSGTLWDGASDGTHTLLLSQEGYAYLSLDAGYTWTPSNHVQPIGMAGVGTYSTLVITTAGAAVAVGSNGSILEFGPQ